MSVAHSRSMVTGQFRLLATRRFWPLFVAQALGAFNDNAFRYAIAILITYELADRTGSDAALLITVATALFVLPFFLFSAVAGELADACDKALLARRIKLAEIAVMAFAAISLQFDSPWLQIFFLFLAGVQSAFFGPVKYGILPQLLHRDELIGGNGLVEMGTFVAILLGTLFGGLLVLADSGRALVGAATVVLAVIGWLAARLIPPAPPVGGGHTIDWNQLRATGRVLAYSRLRPDVFRAILGISWFWFLGAIFVTELPVLTKDVLAGDDRLANFFIAAFTIGIAGGALSANRLLKAEISARYVPAAALLLTAMIVEVYFAVTAAAAAPGAGLLGIGDFLANWAGWRVFIDLIAISFLAGLYVVPLYAMVQVRTAPARRARVIAANNIINAGFMAGAAGLAAGGLAAGLSVPELFLAVGIVNGAAALYTVGVLPQEIAKLLARIVFRVLYRAEARGLEHYRTAGRRTVVVANHPSRIDGALLAAFLPGRPQFVIDRSVAGRWWARAASRLFELVPIDPFDPAAAPDLAERLRRGGGFVIFPEGGVSDTGALTKVSPVAAMAAHLADAAIVPVRIDGPQHSPWSGLRGNVKARLLPKITLTGLDPVTLDVGSGLKGPALHDHLADRLYRLMSGMMFRTSPADRHLMAALIAAAGLHGRRREIIEDIDRSPWSYGRLVMACFVLGRRLAKLTNGETNVGVLLPNAVGCLVAALGLSTFGRVPALLNFATGGMNMAAACLAAEVSTIVTSRRFINQAGLGDELALLAKQARILYLEDIRAAIGPTDKLYGLWARAFPGLAFKLAGSRHDPGAPAAVLFTSGSEGIPKGVALSHRNLLANCLQVAARIDFSGRDTVFNPLPMFHAFGFTVGTLLPVLAGVRTFLYPSPLHYKIVPQLCYETRATILLATDTFLMGYGRNAHPYDFHAVRYVVAGAERVKPETRELWMEKFGLRIIEGYGATECSPVIAANTPMHFRSGTVGRLLDGIDHRLMPVEGLEGAGRLSVKGPNVMLGYLRADEPGAIEPPPDGWHDTGDIVSVDDDGFLTIAGRARRFSKIGGEMVSHEAVEAKVAAVYPDGEHAVVALHDDRKGEQLVLVTTSSELDRGILIGRMRELGVAQLMLPRHVLQLDELPKLVTGKINYGVVNRLAHERLRA